MVLRSVRTHSEGTFVPHVSLGAGILLAFVCVATLVYFVNPMAGRINVDTVIEPVSRDKTDAVKRLTVDEPSPAAPPVSTWRDARPVHDGRRGYLQQLDEEGLAVLAAAHGTRIRLLARPGDDIFPGAPIALATPMVDGVGEAIRDATALGPQREKPRPMPAGTSRVL